MPGTKRVNAPDRAERAAKRAHEREAKERPCSVCLIHRHSVALVWPMAIVGSVPICSLCMCVFKYPRCKDCGTVHKPEAKACSKCECKQMMVLEFGEPGNTEDPIQRISSIAVGADPTADEETRIGAWRYLSAIPGGSDVTYKLFKNAMEIV